MLPKPALMSSANEPTPEALTGRHKQQARCKVSGAVEPRFSRSETNFVKGRVGLFGQFRPALSRTARAASIAIRTSAMKN